MAKKKKKKPQAPSLSTIDKAIYFLLITGSLAAGLFLYPIIIGNFRRTVFQNSHILAQNTPGIVFLGFFGLLLGGGFAVLLDWLRRRKQPIFGKTNIKYGPPQWKPVYPLFSRTFWMHFVSNKKQALIVIATLVLLVFLVFSMTALALPPRECLYDNGTIAVYNCLNKCTQEYNCSDIAQVRIYTRKFYDRHSPDWGIEMEITMQDGEDFFFSYNDFQTLDEAIRGSITGMYQIKSQVDPGMVILEGEESIPYVIQEMNLNQHEIDLLYSLFDLQPR